MSYVQITVEALGVRLTVDEMNTSTVTEDMSVEDEHRVAELEVQNALWRAMRRIQAALEAGQQR